jgi:hypothetical protein
MVAKNNDLPEGLKIDGLTIKGTPTALIASKSIELVVNSNDEQAEATLSITIVKTGTATSQKGLIISSDGRYQGRPPYLADESVANNSFRMNYWYKNLAKFDYPNSNKPAEGENIEYIYTPDGVSTNRNYVVYRPVWPGFAP